jgi:hypothetical protein
VRLIVQPMAGGFELCARLGLVFTPSRPRGFINGKVVHAALGGSPSARAGIERRDIVASINGQPWDCVRLLVFSDRSPSEIAARIFFARYFRFAKITVLVPPEPYKPLDDIAAEARSAIVARPTVDMSPYRNPRLDDYCELLARFSRRRRR